MSLQRLFYVLFILLLKFGPVTAQSGYIRFLVDTSITLMQEHAVNTKAVDWNQVRPVAIQKATGIENPLQLGPVFRYLFQSVNDFHGSFFYKDSVFRWNGNSRVIPDEVMTEWKKGVKIIPLLLEDGMAYLRMPSMPGGSKADFDRLAQAMNDSLCVLLEQNIRGLVLDMRLNGGGAMFPMILGVEQLLPDGKLGSFTDKPNQDWWLKDHQFLLDTTVLASIRPRCIVKAQQLPVAILIGPGTASSGEFTLMTFAARKNTMLIGAKTAGYITGNTGFAINDSAFMNLAVSYGRDSRGKVYKQAIEPGIRLDFPDRFNDILQDEKVRAAIQWLKARRRK